MQESANLLTLRRELRALLALAIPVILSELGWVAMGIVDTIMVGRLGPEAIGAVGISSASYYAPALFGIGILLGLDTVVSQAWGRRDFQVCHQWLAQAVYLVIVYAPFAMLGIAAVPLLFDRLGINPAVSGEAAVYLHILNLGTLPLLIYAAFRRYLHAANALQITAESGIDEQGQRAEIENVQVHGSRAGDCGVYVETVEEQRHRGDAEHGEWRICDDQVNALR